MADLWRAKGDQFFDSSGNPLNGGRFRYYDAQTTSARTVYQDSDALVPWTQPIELDSAGRLTASIYVPTGDFKERLSTSGDVDIYTEDNIPGAITIPDADFARPETPVITKAANYTVAAADLGSLFEVDATGGDFTLTLLSAITAGNGATIWVQQTGSGGKTTIATTGGQTINGASSIALFRQYSGVKITSDGANWSAVATDFPFGTLSKTANYTVTLADYGKLIKVDATSGNLTVTLPTVASAGAGFIVGVKKTDASANTVTLDGDGSETIDGATTFVLNGQHEAVFVRCDGSAWQVESRRSIAASATYAGLVELATVAESGTGTDTARAVTPAGLFPAETDVASATPNIGAAASDKVRITGTTAITAFDTVAAGIHRMGRFADVLTLTHNATSLILPGAANITTAANDRFEAYSLGSGNWLVNNYLKATGQSITGSLKGLQIITASGTYTRTAGVTQAIIIVTGGGGAGGGASDDGSGSGGGSGETRIAFVTPGSTETVTIGAGGTGVSGNNGNDGGNTSFGSHVTANGGGGGVEDSPTRGTAGTGGSGGTSLLAQSGQRGDSAAGSLGGAGGASFWGGGGFAQFDATATGISAQQYGAGGGGATTTGTSDQTGGAGFGGLVVVFEFA